MTDHTDHGFVWRKFSVKLHFVYAKVLLTIENSFL